MTSCDLQRSVGHGKIVTGLPTFDHVIALSSTYPPTLKAPAGHTPLLPSGRAVYRQGELTLDGTVLATYADLQAAERVGVQTFRLATGLVVSFCGSPEDANPLR